MLRQHDKMADPSDAARTMALLGSAVVFNKTISNYGHGDFNWALSASEVVFPSYQALERAQGCGWASMNFIRCRTMPVRSSHVVCGGLRCLCANLHQHKKLLGILKTYLYLVLYSITQQNWVAFHSICRIIATILVLRTYRTVTFVFR